MFRSFAPEDASLTYTSNAMLATLKDAENNLTTYDYDGHDRLAKTRFPLPAKGANASSTTDYAQPGYDAASNVISLRGRAGETIAFTYDNLDRQTLKNLPGSEPDVSYAYDNLNRLTSASQAGNALSFTYDALSRNLTQAGPQGTVTSEWDVAGRRTKLTWPGSGLFVDHDYLVTGETVKIRENGATSSVGVLATYAYDDLGRRTGLTFGNGAAQAYGYDPVSRLASHSNNLTGTANDLTQTFAHNPASQIASQVRTGDAYAWTGHFNQNVTGTANGLNQLTNVGPKTLTHDSKGNVTAFGTRSFTYSSENLLLTGPGSTSLSYDPVMRLRQTVSGGTTARFAYDGLGRIAEYDGSDVLQRRTVHGPGVDQPIVWYEGSGTADRRFLGADERGSIVSVTDSSGAVLALNKYDEFGQPQSTNLGIWGYTGQAWLPTIGLWHYKARAYDPELGRFLQTDPIGYADSPNLYAYVLNDPVNLSDPLGLNCEGQADVGACAPIVVTACQNGGTLMELPWGNMCFNPFEAWDRMGRLDFGIDFDFDISHKYDRTFRITKQDTQCTEDQARTAMMNAAVPGRSGNNVSGQTYKVSWFGSSRFSGPDTIRFRSQGSSFINETLSDHYLRVGSVAGNLQGNQQTGFLFSVSGAGNNVSAFRAWMNRVVGPQVFKSAARQMNQELLSACGG